MLKSIFKILPFFLLVLSLRGYGQELEDFIPEEKHFPISVYGAVEIGNFALSRILEDVDFRELTADVQVKNFLLSADLGYAALYQTEEYHHYSNKGNYLRVGLDYNFIKDRHNPNIIFGGFRYCVATFDENIDFSTYNAVEGITLWPEERTQMNQSGISGSWGELVAGMKVDIFKGFHMGLTCRYKILASDDRNDTFSNYYIPGYGKRTGNSNWGISYYVGYRLRIKK